MPFKVGRRRRRVPIVTLTLIAMCVLASFAFFPYMLGAAHEAMSTAESQTEFNAIMVRELGGFMFYPDLRGLYTWLTSAFLHGDLVHLASNMFFLWLFGSVVEDAVGRGRYLGLYIAGAAAAAALYTITSVLSPEGAKLSLGASGALAAVMGVFATRFHSIKMRFAYVIGWRPGTFEARSVWGVGMWGLGELAYGILQLGGLSSGTAHWAHLGGLLFGVGAALTMGFLKDASREYLIDDLAMYQAAGAHSAAAGAYAKLAESDPDDPFWALAQARETLLAGPSDRAAASKTYASALDRLLRSGRRIEVLDAYEQLGSGVAELPARLLVAIGGAAESSQRRDLAVRAYAEAWHAEPASADAEKAAFRIPHVYLACEMEAEAQGTWRTFVERFPGSAWVEHADRRLAAVVAPEVAPVAAVAPAPEDPSEDPSEDPPEPGDPPGMEWCF